MYQNSLFWLMIGTYAGTCFTAVGARCLRHFSRHTLKEFCQKRKAKDFFGEILRRHEHVALAVEMLSTLFAAFAVGSALAWWWHRAGKPIDIAWGPFLLSIVIFGLFITAAKTWLPWAFVRIAAEPFLFYTWRIWKVFSFVGMPLVWCASFLDIVFHRIAGKVYQDPTEDSFEEEIRTIVTEGHREGLLEEDAREMIEGIMELGDEDVASVMVPRTDVHMLPIDIPWTELIADVIASGHTRIPVYGKNRDDILGVLYSKDLLPELARTDGKPVKTLKELLREPLFVPESKPLDNLLHMFQQSRLHIALVLDEYGGVAGLVTIEDVLEEIVGEIVDEHDKEETPPEIEQINDTTWEASGRIHIDEINDFLHITIPDNDDFDTIAGFVFSEVGHVPRRGESIFWNDEFKFTVIEATPRTIDRLRIERLNEEAIENV